MHPQAGQPENHFMAGVRTESAMPMRTRTRPAVPSCLSQRGGPKCPDPPLRLTVRSSVCPNRVWRCLRETEPTREIDSPER